MSRSQWCAHHVRSSVPVTMVCTSRTFKCPGHNGVHITYVQVSRSQWCAHQVQRTSLDVLISPEWSRTGITIPGNGGTGRPISHLLCDLEHDKALRRQFRESRFTKIRRIEPKTACVGRLVRSFFNLFFFFFFFYRGCCCWLVA